MTDAKRLLLIESEDFRRSSRIRLLVASGYEVDVREDFAAAEALHDERSYELVILALRETSAKAIAYSDRLKHSAPQLPILLLADFGVIIPPGTLSQSIEAGTPQSLLEKVAAMLRDSTHIPELGG
jgi:DNA-binding NtrC family response regulator